MLKDDVPSVVVITCDDDDDDDDDINKNSITP